MEAHLRNRRAPGVPLDVAAAETAAPMLEDSGPGDSQQEQPDAAGDSGGAGTTPSEALTQELGLLKASIGMVSSRLKELQKKSENDEAYVRFVHNWLEDHVQRTATNDTQQLAAKVGAFAAGVDRAVEALAKHEEAEAEDATAQEVA